MGIVQVPTPAPSKAPSEKDILLDKLRGMEVRPFTVSLRTRISGWGL